jgi:hypothetical protein
MLLSLKIFLLAGIGFLLAGIGFLFLRPSSSRNLISLMLCTLTYLMSEKQG